MPFVDGRRAIGDFVYDALTEYASRFECHRESVVTALEPEAIHQMRVNARRIRSVVRLFQPILTVRLVSLDEELRWIAASLGAVRDVDVHEAPQELCGALADLRSARTKTLLADLASERFDALRRSLAAAMAERGSDCLPLFQTPAYLAAPDVVEAAGRRARRAGANLDTDSPPTEVHSLRKKAKRFRYVLDCTAQLYGKPGEKQTAALKELQDLLGAFQDAFVAQELAETLRGKGQDVALCGWSAACAESARRLQEQIPDAVRSTFGPRWRRLRHRMTRERREMWK